MTRPTTSAMSRSGPATTTAVHSPSRMISITSASVIFLRSRSCDPRPPAAASDRHPHDVLVGRDHLVAHGDNGLQRHFRVVDGHDHVADVDIAGHALHRLLFAFPQAIYGALRGILEGRGEPAALLGRRDAALRIGRRLAQAGNVAIGADAAGEGRDGIHDVVIRGGASAYERSRSIVRISMLRD